MTRLTPADLSIVVTHYRTPEVLRECLRRLETHAAGVPVVVVDADSGDGTVEWLRAEHPGVSAISVGNHSMANTVNAGLKRTRSPAVLQMNADVYLEAETLPALLEALSEPGVGMVGPRCRTADGRWQQQGWLYRRHHWRLERGASSVPVDWLSGCCQMVRREALERVGGIDASFRFYNEDMEWCYRLRRAGFGVRLVNTALTHLGGASTPADERFLLEGLRGGMQLARRTRPPWARALHRGAVWGYAALAARSSRSVTARARFSRVRSLFAAGNFDESPFGATLNEDNPRFNQAGASAR